MNSDESEADALETFTPFEHAVLSDMFKIRRPRIARDIDVWTAVDRRRRLLINQSIIEFISSEMPLRNATAQIILKKIEKRLPNYYSPRTR